MSWTKVEDSDEFRDAYWTFANEGADAAALAALTWADAEGVTGTPERRAAFGDRVRATAMRFYEREYERMLTFAGTAH